MITLHFVPPRIWSTVYNPPYTLHSTLGGSTSIRPHISCQRDRSSPREENQTKQTRFRNSHQPSPRQMFIGNFRRTLSAKYKLSQLFNVRWKFYFRCIQNPAYYWVAKYNNVLKRSKVFIFGNRMLFQLVKILSVLLVNRYLFLFNILVFNF